MSQVRVKLPSSVLSAVRRAEHEGHQLVSQGCGLFRCVRCEHVGFLTDAFSSVPKCPKPMSRKDFVPSQFY